LRREITTVQVSRRILWVGGEAYPLQNIARARTVQVTPRRGAMLWSFAKTTLFCGVVGLAATIALDYVDPPVDEYRIRRAITAAVTTLVLFNAIRLVAGLVRRTRYALVIETAGNPRTALVTRDRHIVEQLVHQIMAAIDNPDAEFSIQVTNYHFGDNILQFGPHSTGKAMR